MWYISMSMLKTPNNPLNLLKLSELPKIRDNTAYVMKDIKLIYNLISSSELSKYF